MPEWSTEGPPGPEFVGKLLDESSRVTGWERKGSPLAFGPQLSKLSKASRSASSVLSSSLPTPLDPFQGLRAIDSVQTIQDSAVSYYQLEFILGLGAFGTVWQVRRQGERQAFAMKTVALDKVRDQRQLESELLIARRLSHPNIVRLHQTFRDAQGYHLVMELCHGGDLLQRLKRGADNGGFTSSQLIPLAWRELRSYLWQMLSGLAYLHHYRFAHRDIKPQNYLLATAKAGSALKLADFGLACSFQRGSRIVGSVGTLRFAAPEVLVGELYDERCDVWSLGAVVYIMATGRFPIDGLDQRQVSFQLLEGKVSYENPLWGHHPKVLRNLVAAMLQRNPSDRASVKELISAHPWVRPRRFGGPSGCCITG